MEENFQLIKYLQHLNETLSLQEIKNIITNPKQTLTFDISKIPALPAIPNKDITDSILLVNKQFETEESRQMKDNVLKSLQAIVTKWSIEIAEKEKYIYKDQLQNCAAVLLPYGSALLKVTSQDSDLDLICIAPGFLDRKQHFFKGLYQLLEVLPEVTKINKIESGKIPIIKLYYKGSSVDINFAQINRDTIPKNIDQELDELRKSILNTEKQSIDALNGRKNGFMIIKSVQDEKQFVDTLRIIKLWSKQRGISGNMIGYLGGISWAIMVAKICQMFPNLNAHQTVYLFFKVYSLWDWWNDYVVIDDEETASFTQQWRDTQNQKQNEAMRIFTPAFPNINSSFKVNLLTFKTIGKELFRGVDILESETLTDNQRWEKLFEKYDIFDDFKYSLTLSIVSNSSDLFHRWSGFCEAQFVSLLTNIAEYLIHGQMQSKQHQSIQQDNNPYIQMDENISSSGDKYELRLSSFGIENIEIDFKSSYTYMIGIKKLDPTAQPLFLICPVARFSEYLLRNKQKQIFNSDDNMKIYFQPMRNIKKLQETQANQSQSQESQKRKASSQLEEKEILISERKKVQVSLPESAELIKRMSHDHQFLDEAALNKKLDDMF